MPPPHAPYRSCLGFVFGPLPLAVLPQKIFVVQQQFIQAGPGVCFTEVPAAAPTT